MRTSLSAEKLAAQLARQLDSFFPDRKIDEQTALPFVLAGLADLRICLERTNGKYSAAGDAFFDHLHTDHYAAYLYLVARAAREADRDLATRCYALNKALHSLDVYFEVELPPVFAFQHPVGTVIGRARFEDFFFVYQSCSIGSNLKNEYPSFGRGVVMFGGSRVIGRCRIGANTWVSVGTTIMDQDVPGNCVVFGSSPHLIIKPTERNVVRDMFRVVEP